MAIDKVALLAALKPKTVNVPVEGFGDITIMQLSVDEADALRANMKTEEEKLKFGLKLVVKSVIDDVGNPVFTNEDLPALNASSNVSLDKIVSAALEANGFKKVADAKN